MYKSYCGLVGQYDRSGIYGGSCGIQTRTWEGAWQQQHSCQASKNSSGRLMRGGPLYDTRWSGSRL